MKQFNLSDKILNTNEGWEMEGIPINDVKEFIRLLKEEGLKKWKKEKINFAMGNYFDFIDKLAGDKLIL